MLEIQRRHCPAAYVLMHEDSCQDTRSSPSSWDAPLILGLTWITPSQEMCEHAAEAAGGLGSPTLGEWVPLSPSQHSTTRGRGASGWKDGYGHPPGHCTNAA